MRRSEPPVQYLVGTPKAVSRSTIPHHKPGTGRAGVKVKLLPRMANVRVRREPRQNRQRAFDARRQMKWLWARLRSCSRWSLRAMRC